MAELSVLIRPEAHVRIPTCPLPSYAIESVS